eukprot:454378-Pleurochrysis_carterae.AAC.1
MQIHATLAVWRLECAVALSQFGALRCFPLAVWRLALSPSCSPAPCAAPPPLSPAPCAVPPLTTWRLA